MRRVIQLLSFLLFLTLFFLSAYPLQQAAPVDLFLRLDPLVALTVFLVARTIVAGLLWSLVLVGFSIVFGRAFCGYLCPLGSVLDVSDHFLRKSAHRDAPGSSPRLHALRRVKFLVLVFVLTAAAFGLMTLHLFDPLVILTRVLTILLYPAVLLLGNGVLDALRPAAEALNLFTLARLSFAQYSYYMGGVTLVFFGLILAAGRWQARFWCRNICPLGALLGLFGRYGGFVRRTVTDACVDCGQCQRICPTAAIPENPRATRFTECIHCRACERICPTHAIRFPATMPSRSPAPDSTSLALSRRGFLAAAGAGAVTGFLAGVHPSKRLLDERLIRPPGAVPEDLFLDRCIRCGQCMKACLTNTLQPSFLEAGPEGLWTPRLALRYAPCEQRCNVCGQVCPTGAIRPLDMPERQHAKIGTAVLYRDRCLVWEQDRLCLICDEHCPYDAIEFRLVEGQRRPFVLEDRCNGCGVCENKCPVQGQAAIVVTPMAALRLAEGSYIEEARRRGYEFQEAREETERFLPEAPPAPSPEATPAPDLPPGFTQD